MKTTNSCVLVSSKIYPKNFGHTIQQILCQCKLGSTIRDAEFFYNVFLFPWRNLLIILEREKMVMSHFQNQNSSERSKLLKMLILEFDELLPVCSIRIWKESSLRHTVEQGCETCKENKCCKWMIISDLGVFMQESEIEAVVLVPNWRIEFYCDLLNIEWSLGIELGMIKSRTEGRRRGLKVQLLSLLLSLRFAKQFSEFGKMLWVIYHTKYIATCFAEVLENSVKSKY